MGGLQTVLWRLASGGSQLWLKGGFQDMVYNAHERVIAALSPRAAGFAPEQPAFIIPAAIAGCAIKYCASHGKRLRIRSAWRLLDEPKITGGEVRAGTRVLCGARGKDEIYRDLSGRIV